MATSAKMQISSALPLATDIGPVTRSCKWNRICQAFAGILPVLIAFGLFVSVASAATETIGFVTWDVTFPGNSGAFDITNETGPNASTFPDRI